MFQEHRERVREGDCERERDREREGDCEISRYQPRRWNQSDCKSGFVTRYELLLGMTDERGTMMRVEIDLHSPSRLHEMTDGQLNGKFNIVLRVAR